jgi:hypothetical protein
MKKIYTYAAPLFFFFVLAGCSKDFLRSYEYRIIGSWRITDIDRRGSGNSNNLPFTDGQFTFAEDGRFTWTNGGRTYQGSWDIRKERRGDDQVQSLHLTAVDFAGQDVRSEYFTEINFTNTNRLKAYIHDGRRTYIYRFLRL